MAPASFSIISTWRKFFIRSHASSRRRRPLPNGCSAGAVFGATEVHYRAHNRRAELLEGFTVAVGNGTTLGHNCCVSATRAYQGGGSGMPTLADIRRSQHDVATAEQTIDTWCRLVMLNGQGLYRMERCGTRELWIPDGSRAMHARAHWHARVWGGRKPGRGCYHAPAARTTSGGRWKCIRGSLFGSFCPVPTTKQAPWCRDRRRCNDN